jgi:hypothetical protein
MSLAEGKVLIDLNESDLLDTEAAIEKWQHFPASSISHHGRRCCRLAREWVFSMDYSQLNGESLLAAPRWLRQKFDWGPSPWPLTWCEAVEQESLDCGALASLAHEIFTARGVKSFPTQFIQQYSEQAARHWHKQWNAEGTPANWIKEDLIYHEGCAVVVRDNEIRIWDPSASWWMNPKQLGGYGGILAIRIFDTMQNGSSSSFNWGKHRLTANQWQKVERGRTDFA